MTELTNLTDDELCQAYADYRSAGTTDDIYGKALEDEMLSRYIALDPSDIEGW